MQTSTSQKNGYVALQIILQGRKKDSHSLQVTSVIPINALSVLYGVYTIYKEYVSLSKSEFYVPFYGK